MLWAERRQAAQTAAWPITPGRIVSSTTESYKTWAGSPRRPVTLYQAMVEYSFQVNFGGQEATGQGPAETKAARYTQGSDVTVHYDPRNPSNAVLEVKAAFSWLLAVITLVFLGLAFHFSGVHV